MAGGLMQLNKKFEAPKSRKGFFSFGRTDKSKNTMRVENNKEWVAQDKSWDHVGHFGDVPETHYNPRCGWNGPEQYQPNGC